ncbi:MAG: hypothetical protein A2Y12_06900 [Planctomycetes bacterium GWF2_42_9]|nr:MAG: hypothetical protein A2Y12_06900 [Planctomycetes bacterium GWF2_42_9]
MDMDKIDNLELWKRRRKILNQKLWDLLLAGNIKRPEKPKYEIIAKGEQAEKMIEENLKYVFKAFPSEKKLYPELTYKWHGPVTWDTFIISYPGWPGEPSQRAILRIPKSRNNPLPAVLCFHGHGRGCLLGKSEMDYIALPLTAKGYITLCPDATRWEDRRDKTYEKAEINDFKGMAFYSERNLAMPLLYKGQTLLGVIIWEHMIAVDVLQSMDFVDLNKIGTIGTSMGGVQSFWLSAMDKRITCGVESCGVSSFEVWSQEKTLNALVNFIPHILRHTDWGEIGGLIAPRPFMCLDAAQDGFFPLRGIKSTHKIMYNIFNLYNASEKFKKHIHTGGHLFIDKHIELAFKWLDYWLTK